MLQDVEAQGPYCGYTALVHIKTSQVIGAPGIHTITMSFGQMEADVSDKRIAFLLQDVEAQSPNCGYTAVVHIKTFRVIGAPAIHITTMSFGQVEADVSDKCIALMLQDAEAQCPYCAYTAVVRIKTSPVIGAPGIHTITVRFSHIEADASDKRIAFMLQDVGAQSPDCGYIALVHIKTSRVIGAPGIHTSTQSFGQIEADASDKRIAFRLEDFIGSVEGHQVFRPDERGHPRGFQNNEGGPPRGLTTANCSRPTFPTESSERFSISFHFDVSSHLVVYTLSLHMHVRMSGHRLSITVWGFRPCFCLHLPLEEYSGHRCKEPCGGL